MYSQTYILLQNEGYLLQGCIRAALGALLKSSSVERGSVYTALFTYSIGLERLLKLALILDHCIENEGTFPTWKQIKNFGHNLSDLHYSGEKLVQRYLVKIPAHCQMDDIDGQLINLLADFAMTGRYFNLDMLTTGGNSADPLPELGSLLKEIYERDVPPLKRISDEEQIDALAKEMKATIVYVPHIGFDGTAQSYDDFFSDHGRITLTMPEIVWRFARILYPLQMLIFEMDESLHSGRAGNPEDFPHMWEICAFCSNDKQSTLNEIRNS